MSDDQGQLGHSDLVDLAGPMGAAYLEELRATAHSPYQRDLYRSVEREMVDRKRRTVGYVVPELYA